jgi:hypothetical protein
MAKRRKEKDEEEEKPFKLPKFDEEQFLKRERRNIKTTYLSAFFGFIMALVCFGFWALMGPEQGMRWPLVLLIGLVYAAAMKYVFLRLNVDLTDFTGKNWFASYAVYFFTWLVVFIVLVNPPIYDDEAPKVEIVTLPNIQEFGGTIKIAGLVTDNVEVKDIDFKIDFPDGSSQTITDYTFSNYILEYEFVNDVDMEGDFTYIITISDVNGRSTKRSGTFSYSNNAILLTTPSNESELNSYTPIEFRVDKDIFDPVSFQIQGSDKTFYMDFRVYYVLNNVTELNVSRVDDDDREEYKTTAEFEGWEADQNSTLRAYVEVTKYFINHPTKITNTIKDTEFYTFTTKDESSIGREDKLVPLNPQYPPNNDNQPDNALNYYLVYPKGLPIPGFEIIVLIAALVIVILIFKYKKKDEKNKK